MSRLLPIVLVLWLAGLCPVAAAQSATPWVELSRVRNAPADLADAVWFEPPSATMLELVVEADTTPQVWRVELDGEGRAVARVAQRPSDEGDGHYLLWTSPAPAAPLAVVVPGGGSVHAYVPDSRFSQRSVVQHEQALWRSVRRDTDVPPTTAPTGETYDLTRTLARVRDQLTETSRQQRKDGLLDLIRLRRAETLLRGTPYMPRAGRPAGQPRRLDGQPVELDLIGPGVAVLNVQVTSPEDRGPIAFDLIIDGGETGRQRIASSVLCAGEDGRCSPRQFQLTVPPGRQAWSVSLEGADGELQVRSYRLRPVFPRTRGGALTSDLDEIWQLGAGEPERVVMEALGSGDYEDAEAAILTWLEQEPDDPDAQMALGHLQARGGTSGALPAAWQLLERSIRDHDLAGPGPAQGKQRWAARQAWLQGAYQSAGVLAPEKTMELVVGLRPDDGLASASGEGWYRGGVRALLPVDEEVPVAVPSDGSAASWTTVRWLGVNTTGRPAVIAITVDDQPPLRVLLQGERTPFRLALAPGSHRIRWQAPAGVGDGLALGADRWVEQPGGPWGTDFPALRVLPFVRLEPGQTSGEFQLPAGVESHHVRLEARWEGNGEQQLEADDGRGVRQLSLAPADQVPVMGADADGGGGVKELALGAATFDVLGEGLTVRNGGDEGVVWLRLLLRQPRDNPRSQEPVGAEAHTTQDRRLDLERLRALSSAIAAAESPAEQARSLLERAELLAAAGLEAYAQRDCQRICQHRDPGDELVIRAHELETEGFAIRDHRRIWINGARDTAALALDPPAAAGSGPAAWLETLPPGDPAQLLAADDLSALVDLDPFSVAIHRELALRAAASAVLSPDAALLALVHADAVLAAYQDPRMATIRWQAMDATHSQVIGAARSSADRVRLTDAWQAPVLDAAQQAREAMLAGPLGGAHQLLAAGSRWTVYPGMDAGHELSLKVLCDDLRALPVGAPAGCPLQIQVDDGDIQRWVVPTGEAAHRDVRVPDGGRLTIHHEEGGQSRYAALQLSTSDGGWTVPSRSAWFHLATPGAAVEHGVCGPTMLVVEASPAFGGARPPHLEVRVDGELRETVGWLSMSGNVSGDGDERYDAAARLEVPLFASGPHQIDLVAVDGPVAVRVSRREANRTMLPRAPVPPAPLPIATPLVEAVSIPAPDARPVAALRQHWPAPSPGGTLDSRVHLWNRSSLDQEPVDERSLYLELAVTHRLRLGRAAGAPADSWLAGGGLVRAGTPYEPAGGWNLSTYHRIPTIGLRLSGRFSGLVQGSPAGAVAASTLSLRLDRPVRLGAWTLVPHLRARGFFQPSEERREQAGETYLELSSSYRTAHPFALSAGADLLARPWVNGEWLLGLRAVSNADVKSLDLVGGRTELRLYPRPVGVALAFDLSRRLQDDWRTEAWWRAEGSVEAWVDLGPPALWIRPGVQLSYLVKPSRLELTVGVAITPGRRGVEQMAPPELLFEDIRQPEFVDGRWRR